MKATLNNDFSITSVSGRGGDGKSYVIVSELAQRRMVRKNFNLVTNLPLTEAFYEFVAERKGCTVQEVKNRVHILDNETLDSWENWKGTGRTKTIGGPWDLAEHFEKAPTDFILDEAHVFCPKRDRDREKLYQKFLGEARHHGLQRVMFITQAKTKISPVIDEHCHARYLIEKQDRGNLNPRFPIPMSHLYNLWASITGEYSPMTARIEQLKNADEKWVESERDYYRFDEDIYKLYVSHSEPGGKSRAVSTAPASKREYELRPTWLPAKRDYNENEELVWTAPTWLWVITSNAYLFTKTAGIVLLFVFLLCGGIDIIFDLWMKTVNNTLNAKQTQTETELKEDDLFTEKDIQEFNESLPNNSDSCGCAAKAKQLAALEKEIHQRNVQDANDSVLVAISTRIVGFSNGSNYRVGEMIENGIHEGKKVLRIDYPNRRCLISGGDWLRLSTHKPKNYDEPAERLPDPLPGDQAIKEDVDGVGKVKTSSILVSRRIEHETSRSAKAPSQRDESVVRR